jgi:2-phospho-L-lactate guanylyltransferase
MLLGEVRAAAILPVKRFDAAKQRLGEVLGSGSRAALAAAMFADVLGALERSQMLQAIVVVSGERDVGDIVAGRDVIMIEDMHVKGQ